MHKNERTWAHNKYMRTECAIKGTKELEHVASKENEGFNKRGNDNSMLHGCAM
jgi:hypothetical protein